MAISGQAFQVERQGTIAIITPAQVVEHMGEAELQRNIPSVLTPLEEGPLTGLVIDLGKMTYFASIFVSFLIRCHTLAKRHNARVVVAGVSGRVRELLRLTALDTLWQIFTTRDEALRSLTAAP